MKVLITENQLSHILSEEEFRYNQLSFEEKKRLYSIFKSSYDRATGSSWDENKFNSRAQNWVFYGNHNEGFLSVNPQSNGTLKITTGAGDLKEIFGGIEELLSKNVPVWGMMAGKLSKIFVLRYGFVHPPQPVMDMLIQTVLGDMLGSTSHTKNANGSITFHYDDIGESNKVFVANKIFYKFLLGIIDSNNIEIPLYVKTWIESL